MPNDRVHVPPEITCTKEAYQYLRVTRGTPVYLKVQTGDYDIRTKQSVTLMPGHEGVIDEIYLSDDIWWKVRIKITDPPAQPFLIWQLEDFLTNWTTDPQAFPNGKLLTRHERLEEDRLGHLMG